ncbi:MAG TPA: PAS domain-containing protein [Anaerolineales bacterium]|nr:PAS domain-containing protein [Anaerolineales bacterium]
MSNKNINNRLESLFSDLVPGSSARQEVADQLLPGWTWECDAQGNYVSCSPEVESVLGFHPEDFTGQPFASFRLAPDSTGALLSALRTGKYPLNLNVQYRTRDGELVPVSLHVFKLSPSQGGRWGGFAQALFVSRREPPAHRLEQPGSELSPPKLIPDNHPQPFTTGEIGKSLAAEENRQNGNDQAGIEAPEKIRAAGREPADHILAGQKIIEILESIRLNSAEIGQFECSRLRTNQKEELKEDRTQRPVVTGSLSGIEIRSYPKMVVQEIEHKLEWGNKLDLTAEDKAYLERNRYSSGGLSGVFQRRGAPKEILKHDKFWIAVYIVVEKGRSKRIWIDSQRDQNDEVGMSLEAFLGDPEVLVPDLLDALASPFSSRETLRIGEDYLISR